MAVAQCVYFILFLFFIFFWGGEGEGECLGQVLYVSTVLNLYNTYQLCMSDIVQRCELIYFYGI